MNRIEARKKILALYAQKGLPRLKVRIRRLRDRGQWLGDTVTLDSKTVDEHPWEKVQVIALHEMAHRLAGLRGYSKANGGHGKAWLRHCRRLGIGKHAALHLKWRQEPDVGIDLLLVRGRLIEAPRDDLVLG